MDIEFFKRFVKTKDGPRELIKKMMQRGQQNVHTPYSLCKQMIGKLSESCDIKNSNIAVLFNVEFVETLITDFGVNPANIIMFADDKVEGVFCKLQYKMKWGENLFTIDIAKTVEEKKLITDSGEMDMKFDVVVGNPPYQAPTENKGGSGHTLWDKFVSLSLDVAKNDGYVCLVHPCGWRRISGSYLPVGKTIRDKKVKYLEIHDIKDGLKMFGVCSRYDWYVLQNSINNNNEMTEVKDEDGVLNTVNLSITPCVPNGKFDKILSLLAKGDEDRINVIFDSSYHLQKEWMKDSQDDKYKYPCIYSLPQKGIQFKWSSINNKGHFGVSKVIISNGAASQPLIDEDGEYGLTQWALGIVDEKENLPKIKKALESESFAEICKYMRFTLDRYDVKFISGLRKDFWKEFV